LPQDTERRQSKSKNTEQIIRWTTRTLPKNIGDYPGKTIPVSYKTQTIMFHIPLKDILEYNKKSLNQ
jgi:hypothetical protein